MPPRPAILRRTSTKVVNGEVRTKSRFAVTSVAGYTIEREPAMRGFRHVVSPRQLEQFIELIPDWKVLSGRLRCIVLTPGYPLDYFGYFTSTKRSRTAIIALNAWPKNLWTTYSRRFFREHRWYFDALGVVYLPRLNDVICRFTVAQARAFTLLCVFVHEVGHHHDWMRRRGIGLPGKEAYADHFAEEMFDRLLTAYRERFGDPAVVNRVE